VKNAGVVKREVGEEITIELAQEYNSLPIFVDTNDSRLQESKVNVVADVDAELTPLTNDVKKVGPRFTEEVFLYVDRVETHPLAANTKRAAANAGATSAEASPARPKFQPKVPFSENVIAATTATESDENAKTATTGQAGCSINANDGTRQRYN
jgi:hypothetical protein